MHFFFDDPSRIENYRVFLTVRSPRGDTKSGIQKKMSPLCGGMHIFFDCWTCYWLYMTKHSKTREKISIWSDCQKKCAPLCGEIIKKNHKRFLASPTHRDLAASNTPLINVRKSSATTFGHVSPSPQARALKPAGPAPAGRSRIALSARMLGMAPEQCATTFFHWRPLTLEIVIRDKKSAPI